MVMRATIFYGPDRLPFGRACSRGRAPTPTRCAFCGDLDVCHLCDAPTPSGTCDAQVCGRCAVGIPALDVDYCPTCVKAPPALLCNARHPDLPISCAGPEVVKDKLCLAHSLLFTHWLSREGGSANVYSTALPLESKREHFRTWTREHLVRATNVLTKLSKGAFTGAAGGG